MPVGKPSFCKASKGDSPGAAGTIGSMLVRRWYKLVHMFVSLPSNIMSNTWQVSDLAGHSACCWIGRWMDIPQSLLLQVPLKDYESIPGPPHLSTASKKKKKSHPQAGPAQSSTSTFSWPRARSSSMVKAPFLCRSRVKLFWGEGSLLHWGICCSNLRVHGRNMSLIAMTTGPCQNKLFCQTCRVGQDLILIRSEGARDDGHGCKLEGEVGHGDPLGSRSTDRDKANVTSLLAWNDLSS